MGITAEERRDVTRNQRLATLREELGLEAIVISSPINTQYFSSTRILTQRLVPDRLAFVVNTQTGRDTFVICDIEEIQARMESHISDIRGYTEFASSPVAVLASVLQEFHAANGAIGFEGRHLVADHYEEFRRLVPAQLVSIDKPLAELRAIKDEAEVEILRNAFVATDSAIAASYEATNGGDSTRKVADRMRSALLANGADEVAFMVIGAGNLTVQGHPSADDNPLQPGDPIRVDFGGSFSGYYSDLARTAFVGSASSKQAGDYKRLWGAFEETLASIRAGVEAREVFARGREAMARSGLNRNETNGVWELSHIGHGIGLDIHEFPILEPLQTQPLEPGMVLCVELTYTEPSNYRLHVEDALVVTEVGTDIFSRSRDWSEPLVIGRD